MSESTNKKKPTSHATTLPPEFDYAWDIIRSHSPTTSAFIRALAVEGKVIDDLLESGLVTDNLVEVREAMHKSRETQCQVLLNCMRANKELASKCLVFIALQQPGIISILHPKLCKQLLYQFNLWSDKLPYFKVQPLIMERKNSVQTVVDHLDMKELTIFCTGHAGVGKSAVVNALKGKQVVKTGKGGLRVSPNVTGIRLEIDVNGANVTSVFYDTPGLTRDRSGPEEFIKMANEIKKEGKDFDLLVLCCSAAAPRDVPEEADMIENITKAFGKKIWCRTIILLTQANLIINPENEETTPEYFHDEGITRKKKFIRQALFSRGGLTLKDADHVPCLPVGHRPFLCDGTEWKKEFWRTCVDRVVCQVVGIRYQFVERQTHDKVQAPSKTTKDTTCASGTFSSILSDMITNASTGELQSKIQKREEVFSVPNWIAQFFPFIDDFVSYFSKKK